jgi:hypothetical protein
MLFFIAFWSIVVPIMNGNGCIIIVQMAGCLIGKAGVNIQKLRSDYGCSVRLPDCPGPER